MRVGDSTSLSEVVNLLRYASISQKSFRVAVLIVLKDTVVVNLEHMYVHSERYTSSADKILICCQLGLINVGPMLFRTSVHLFCVTTNKMWLLWLPWMSVHGLILIFARSPPNFSWGDVTNSCNSSFINDYSETMLMHSTFSCSTFPFVLSNLIYLRIFCKLFLLRAQQEYCNFLPSQNSIIDHLSKQSLPYRF